MTENKIAEREDLQKMFPIEIAKISVKRFIAEDYAILKDTADSLTVNTDKELQNAGDFRKKINTFIKMVEDKRKEIVEPLKRAAKEVDAEFKMPVELSEGVLKTVDEKIKPYLLQQVKAKEEAAARIRAAELKKMEEHKKMLEDAEFETGNKVLLDMANNIAAEAKVLAEKEIIVKKNTKGLESTTSIKKRWLHRIINPSLVTRPFLMVDDSKIKEAIKNHKEEIENGFYSIPGIEFYFEHDLSSR